MRKNACTDPPFSCLTLADGEKFFLHPTDPRAGEIVNRIAEVMHLSPGRDGREIFVCIAEKPVQERFLKEKGPLVCCLSPGGVVTQMSQLARYIAAQTMPRGGMLLHGGLVMHQGQGIILAAPGGTGKSTACSRLPESWKALCDDATLVVQTKSGRYFAHPWPTWSRFLNGEGGDWNVEQAIPLSAIFFLHQSPVDRVEPLPRGNATAYVLESIRQMMLFRRMDEHQIDMMEDLLNISLSAVERLVSSVPVYILQISLSGSFWEEITRTLQDPGKSLHSSPHLMPSVPCDPPCRAIDDQDIPLIYSGSSMYPTFRDADLLNVVPYGTGTHRVGDVICFNSPEKEKYIIHRIVAIHENGIQTRGDNNVVPDPDLVQPDEIIGKVVTGSRASGTWKVTGGKPGILLHRLFLVRKSFLKKIDSLIKTENPIGFSVHLIRNFSSYILTPRYVLFSTGNVRYLRLFIGRHMVGEYNSVRNSWIIRPPFSLFIDKSNLPVVDYPGTNHEISERIQ